LVHAEVVASLLDRRLPRGDSVRAGPLRLGPGAGSPQGGPARPRPPRSSCRAKDYCHVMVAPTPYTWGASAPPTRYPETSFLSEEPSADLAWRILRSYRDVPERGRDLFAGTLAQRNKEWREFRSYVRQAETYFSAGQGITGPSAALPYYYAALNLAKAELMVHAPGSIVPGARIGHGLTTTWGKSSKASGDRLHVRDGVFPLLYRHHVGTLPPREPLPVMRLLRNVPEIGYELEEMGERTGTTQLFNAVVSTNRSAWALLAISAGAPLFASAASMRLLTDSFREVDAPPNHLQLFALSTRFSATRFRFFESRFPVPLVGGRLERNLRLREVQTQTWTHLRKLADEISSAWGDLVLASSLYKTRLLPMPSSLARYAVMFYASEVVRYRPARFDPMEDASAAWLLDAFTAQGALTGLVASLCAIDRKLYRFSSPSALRA